MRLDTNRVVLSSSERTIAPSDLLLSNSYNPGNPVTAMILLYSILMCIIGPVARFRDMQGNLNRSFGHCLSDTFFQRSVIGVTTAQ